MAKKKSNATNANIPDEQYDLPVTFDADGNAVTLRDATAPGFGSILSFAALKPEKQIELTVKRIEAQPKFELSMIDAGIVDKTRAIQEVKAGTEIGRILIEIEQRVINNLMNQLTGKR